MSRISVFWSKGEHIGSPLQGMRQLGKMMDLPNIPTEYPQNNGCPEYLRHMLFNLSFNAFSCSGDNPPTRSSVSKSFNRS